MENTSFDLKNIRRYLDFPLKIETIRYYPKNNWVHRHNRVSRYFLCFVLNEESPETMTVNGKTLHFNHVPRMGLVEPGSMLESVVPACREELFFSYPADAREPVEMFHLHSCDFEFTPAFNETLQRIKNNFSRLECPGVADRLDCLAVELAQEAMIAALEKGAEGPEMPDERIFLISKYFQIHYNEHVVLAPLLKKYGITRRTFYREWAKYYTVTPAQYLIDLRLKHACEDLVTSQKKIYEIAAASGFCDAMYFNQCFVRHLGCSPQEYRKKNLLPV